MTSASEPLLEVTNVSKHFHGRTNPLSTVQVHVNAVDDVTLRVWPGETLGLVGESGCGKSTLARIIVRLLEPSAGIVRFEGQDITRVSQRRLRPLRREMQIVFQDPSLSLNPRKTVGQILEAPFKVHKIPGDRHRAVSQLLDDVGLSRDHYNRYPHQFSGGQRQRIGIARALALRPRLLILDEPVSALDVSIQAQILELMRHLREQYHLTMIFVSHDLAVVRQMADRIAVMYLGRVVEAADAEALYQGPKHPYTAALLSAVPGRSRAGVGQERIALRGDPAGESQSSSVCGFVARCPRRVRGTCDEMAPPRAVIGPEHAVLCHYPLERWPITQEEIADAGVFQG